MKFVTKKDLRRTLETYVESFGMLRDMLRASNEKNRVLEAMNTFLHKMINNNPSTKLIYISDNVGNHDMQDVCFVFAQDYLKVNTQEIHSLILLQQSNEQPKYKERDLFLSEGDLNILAYTFSEVLTTNISWHSRLLCNVRRTTRSYSTKDLDEANIYIEDFITSTRGKGVGTIMLECLKKYIDEINRSSKFGKIHYVCGGLSTVDYDEVNSEKHKRLINFYKKNGFEVNGNSIKYKIVKE